MLIKNEIKNVLVNYVGVFYPLSFQYFFFDAILESIVTMLENANILNFDYHQSIVDSFTYVFGFCIFYLFIRKTSIKEHVSKPLVMTPKKFIMFLIVTCGIGYFFGFVADFLNERLLSLFNLPSFDLVETVFSNNNLIGNITCAVIIGPITKELIYRKLIIDRINDYGQLLPIVFSTVIFRLMHGYLSQTIYATANSLFLGFIYVKYDNIKYCVLIHMFLNSLSIVVFSYIITNEIIIILIYLILIVITIFYLYLNRKEITFEKGNLNLTM